MPSNPFNAPPGFARPLRLEVCQQIHATALATALSGKVEADEVPPSVDLIALRKRVRSLGRDASLLHPASIEQCFAGMTLAVYLTIQELYCSRIERRIHMIWTIINAMAQQKQISALSYEAVWAICVSLSKRRMRGTSVFVERMATAWWVIVLPEEQDANGEEVFPSLACVLDETCRLVIAFRAITSPLLSEAIHLALYDALVLHRYPSREAPAAVIWYLPERVLIDEALPFTGQHYWAQLGLLIERQNLPRSAQVLRDQWMHEVTTRRLKPQRWLSAFDSYLHKVYGYSPRRLQEERDRDFASFVGFTREPGWNFPALRLLLPERPAMITVEGTIIYRGNIYRDDLLHYWPGASVTVRSSEPPTASLWVYLQGEVLCLAVARTFRQPLASDQGREKDGAMR